MNESTAPLYTYVAHSTTCIPAVHAGLHVVESPLRISDMADLLLSLTHLCPPLPSSALLCPPLPSLPSLLLPSAQVFVPRLAVSSIISTSYSDVAMLDLAFGQSIHTEAGLEYVLCRVDGRPGSRFETTET